ncbi:zinc finger protein 385B isoform X2 [Dunckerocampus dactyliophorus]|uniref:zinc finger protein 385B isoform X2 n=1 Tax=Dunckerocampus dactyliophorus TaxID=161453 RepID=UPI00240769AE|nr:zinc finger protein 385B isoform X2 [Dunckerocampus dactyliophorus]
MNDSGRIGILVKREMKTLRPSHFLEGGPTLNLAGACPQRMDAPAVSISVSAASSTYSLCTVCNLQLTSAAQAQLHYNARSHLRRVRQMKVGQAGAQVAGGQSKLLLQASGRRCQSAQVQASEHSAPLCSTRGSVCATLAGALPGLIGGAGGPSVLMKPFLSFPMDTTAPVALFPNFNTMDPVQKAVINHTFGVAAAAKKKQVITCGVCRLRFNSDSQAEAHYRGSRHAKKMKSQENKSQLSITAQTNGSSSMEAGPAPPQSTNQHTDVTSLAPFPLPSSSTPISSPSSSRGGSETPPTSPASTLPVSSSSPPAHPIPPPPPPPRLPPLSQEAPPIVDSEEEKAKKLLYCSLCKVAVNSLSQLQAHNAGSKHKTMLDARSGAGPIKSYPRPGAKLKTCGSPAVKGSGLQNKTFHCQICDVHVNSEIQLKQHITSRRHKDRVAGKPSKAKYTPYSNNNMRTQRSSFTVSLVVIATCHLATLLTSFLFLLVSFQELAKSFLPPHPFSTPPASLSTSSPLSIALHPRPPSSSPLIAASLLRSAPGPIRAGHTSVLFTPY